MSYIKPWLSYQAQLELLIKRGMVITDNSRALNYLERIGYYRLSGYWNAFRIRNSDKTFSDDFRVEQLFRMLSNCIFSINGYACLPWTLWSGLKSR